MKTSTVIWLIVLIVVIVVGVLFWMGSGNQNTVTTGTYGSGATSTGSTPTTTASSTPASGTGATGTGSLGVLVLNTASDPALGTYLVATNGMTLYHYTPDKTNVSNCTGQCSVIWPPYTVASSSSLPGALGVTGTVGTIKRSNGVLQVTYNGKPLYFYSKDSVVGDVKGQNVGGVWFVVAP